LFQISSPKSLQKGKRKSHFRS